jgi:hypothetical protein
MKCLLTPKLCILWFSLVDSEWMSFSYWMLPLSVSDLIGCFYYIIEHPFSIECFSSTVSVSIDLLVMLGCFTHVVVTLVEWFY